VIRAHYLAHELRYYCGRYNLAASLVANAVAENLEKWATRFGAELEAMESSPDRAGNNARRPDREE
jgi:UDP-N-acetylmuramyl pentapeptide synthase